MVSVVDIGASNDLLIVQCQVITWTLETNFIAISSKLQ